MVSSAGQAQKPYHVLASGCEASFDYLALRAHTLICELHKHFDFCGTALSALLLPRHRCHNNSSGLHTATSYYLDKYKKACLEQGGHGHINVPNVQAALQC